MSFALKKNEPVTAGIYRVVRQQVERAITEASDPDMDPALAVHEVRKRCKRVRAALRLVRCTLGTQYGLENAAYRDAARGLSDLRDTEALVESFDALMDNRKDEVDASFFSSIRRELNKQRKKAASDQDLPQRLREFAGEMRQARDRIDQWPAGPEGFDGLEDGLKRVYRSCRKLMCCAAEDPADENFHEWRKQEKYHRYHMDMLERVWPEMMSVIQGQTKALSDLLGHHHDLAVLRNTLLAEPEAYGKHEKVEVFIPILDARSRELQDEALLLGSRLFSETPGAFTKRMKAWFEAWRR